MYIMPRASFALERIQQTMTGLESTFLVILQVPRACMTHSCRYYNKHSWLSIIIMLAPSILVTYIKYYSSIYTTIILSQAQSIIQSAVVTNEESEGTHSKWQLAKLIIATFIIYFNQSFELSYLQQYIIEVIPYIAIL